MSRESEPRLPDDLVDAAIKAAAGGGDPFVGELADLVERLCRCEGTAKSRGLHGLAEALDSAAVSATSWRDALLAETDS